MPTTAETVDEVVAAMKAVAAGSAPDALSALRARTSMPAGAAVPPGGGSTPAPAPPEEDALTAATPTMERPNGETYHVRKLGKHDDVAVLQTARKNGIPVLTYGPPGTGKTAMIEAAFGHIETVQGNGDTDVLEFVGSFIQLPNGRFEWVDGPLIRAMETGCPLYIDEVALIEPKVMSVVYGAMDGRGVIEVTQNPERGEVEAKDGFYVIASCNPDAPGARMSEALLSRFRLQFLVNTDYDLAKKLGVPPKVVGAAQNLYTKQTVDGAISWSPQLRELLGYMENEKAFGAPIALANLVSQAPAQDRAVVADVLSRKFGNEVKELSLS